ncbi:MAG: GIY-YIG nuclease family protein [Myxococcaceae bacterium]
MSRWSVYMLRCGDGSLYTGCTNDLDGRVKRHKTGKGARYTRSRPPVRLVWHEPVLDRSAALKREAALKKLTRSEKLVLVKKKRVARVKVKLRRPEAE